MSPKPKSKCIFTPILWAITIFLIAFPIIVGAQILDDKQLSELRSIALKWPTCPLPDTLKLEGKAVISLGEGSHGAKEFHLARNQFFMKLVESNYSRIIGMEIGSYEGHLLNRFVQGVGSLPTDALKKNPLGNSQSTIDLLIWMRTKNETRAKDNKLLFFGFDTFHDAPNERFQILYALNAINYEKGRALKDFLKLRDASLSKINKDDQKAIFEDVSECIQFLLQRPKSRLVDRIIEYLQSLEDRLAGEKVLLGELTPEVLLESVRIRDRSMARRVVWNTRSRLDPRVIFLFAHNQHVQVALDMTDHHRNIKCMGWHLREQLGSGYLSIGMFSATGKIFAKSLSSDGTKLLPSGPVDILPAKEDSLSGICLTANLGPALLLLPSLKKDSPLSSWLLKKQKVRNITAVYAPILDEQFYSNIHIPERYDLILFFPTSTPREAL